jgi:hypothetical protein
MVISLQRQVQHPALLRVKKGDAGREKPRGDYQMARVLVSTRCSQVR